MMTFREQWKTLVWPVFSVCYGADYNSEFCSIYPSNIRWMFISHFRLFSTPCFQCPSQVSARRISRREPRTYMFSGVASITDRLPYTFLLHGSEWYSTVCCTIPYNKKYNFVVYMLIRGQKDTLWPLSGKWVPMDLFDTCDGPHEHSVERALAFSALWM